MGRDILLSRWIKQIKQTGGAITLLLGSMTLTLTPGAAAEICDAAEDCAQPNQTAAVHQLAGSDAGARQPELGLEFELEGASSSAIDLQRPAQAESEAFIVKLEAGQPDLAEIQLGEPSQWDLTQTQLALNVIVPDTSDSTGKTRGYLVQQTMDDLERSKLEVAETAPVAVARSVKELVQPVAAADTVAQSEPAPESATETEEDERNPWRVEIQPYFFVPFDLSGDISIGNELEFNNEFGSGEGEDRFPVTFDFNLGLSDFLELDLTQLLWLAGRLEVWNDDVGLGLIVQGAYSKIGVEQEFDRFDVDLSTETIAVDVALGYNFGGPIPLREVDQAELDGVDEDAEIYPSLGFELFGGARYGSITQEVEFDPGPDFDFGPEWFEPLVGGRITFNLSEDLSFGVRADTSITTSGTSDENWNLFIGIDWQLSPNFSLRPAYRFYSLTVREDGRFGERKVSLDAQGLWLGLVFTF